MDLIAHPGGRAFFAILGLDIVRRADIQCGRRDVLSRTPADLALVPDVVLYPDLPQNFDSGNLTQEKRGCRIIETLQQTRPIGPNHFRVSVTCFLAQWDSRILHPRLVAFDPFRLTVSQQPAGGHQGQNVQGMAQGFSHAQDTIERADLGQHMG